MQALPLIGYAAVVNAIGAGLFWYDKQQALNRGWRVPEVVLHGSALVGGWVGGLWAMKKFRHKTVKKSFQYPYYACIAANVGLIGVFAYNPEAIMQNPAVRNALRHIKL